MATQRILNLVNSIIDLDEASRREFIEALFNELGKKDRSLLVQWVCHCAYPKSKWNKVERWMEGQFRRDMGKTPRKTASIAIGYFRISPKMLPFLVKMAQRVKHRIRARILLNREDE